MTSRSWPRVSTYMAKKMFLPVRIDLPGGYMALLGTYAVHTGSLSGGRFVGALD